MLHFQELLTVKGVAESSQPLTEGKLRAYISNRKRNKFDRCLVRVGGRWFIDTAELDRWLEEQRESGPEAP